MLQKTLGLIGLLLLSACGFITADEANLRRIHRHHGPNFHFQDSYRDHYQEIIFRGLQPHTRYTFYLTAPKNFPLKDTPAYRNLELTLLDENRREIKFNDDYCKGDHLLYDTLSLLRLRTEATVQSDTVFLRISSCGADPKGPGFYVHVKAESMPSGPHIMLRPQPGVSPIILSSNIDPILLDDDCKFEHVVMPLDTVPYDPGHGFGVRLIHCAADTSDLIQRVPGMVHNFRLLYFRPPRTCVYQASIDQADQLGLLVFNDPDFKVDSLTKLNNDSVAERLMAICHDIAVGGRMIGSGKHLPGDTNNTLVLAELNHRGKGLLLSSDSIYYFIVCGQEGKPFSTHFQIDAGDTACDKRFNPNDTSVICRVNQQNAIQRPPESSLMALSHLASESGWRQHHWYRLMPAPRNQTYRISIRGNFEGMMALYTYGDPANYKTYQLIKQQYFGFSTQDPILTSTLTPPPGRELMLAVAAGKGQGGLVNISITPLNNGVLFP